MVLTLRSLQGLSRARESLGRDLAWISCHLEVGQLHFDRVSTDGNKCTPSGTTEDSFKDATCLQRGSLGTVMGTVNCQSDRIPWETGLWACLWELDPGLHQMERSKPCLLTVVATQPATSSYCQ